MRRAQQGGRRSRRSENHAIKRQIPVRTFADWDDVQPGSYEADFVVHSGGSMKGSPIHTFVLTDVYSGWTEAVPLIVREKSLVVEALGVLQRQSPVPIVGLDTDNDSAFMNETLLDYCRVSGIAQTRSRAHHKNDQAWVEQKNGAIVRRLVGYERLEGVDATRVLAWLYGAARLYINFFQPSFKLKEKFREGAKVTKSYHRPATPCERLLAHDRVPADIKTRLIAQRTALDPVRLLHMLRRCQEALARLAGTTKPVDAVSADIATFVSELPTQSQTGESHPDRQKRQATPRTWRTRKDPFEAVWTEACQWLKEHPDGTGRQLFDALCENHPDTFSPGQLRTLQRRVGEWRSQMARALILPGEPQGAIDEWLTGEAAE